jgi:hypothetical protein
LQWLRGCRRGRKLVPVVGIGTVDGDTKTLERPTNIDSPERDAGLREQVLEIPHPLLQPTLPITEVIVDHMGVLGSLRVPEELALPVTGERGTCSEFSEPLLILRGLIHWQGPGVLSIRHDSSHSIDATPQR